MITAKNIINTIDSYSAIYPHKPAHIWRNNVLTYMDLYKRSNSLANHIIQKYGDDRTPIIVYGQKQNEMLVCFLACVKAGHAYIPVDSSLPVDRINGIFESSQAKLMLSIDEPEAHFENVDTIDAKTLTIIFESGNNTSPDKSFCVKEYDVYYIIYTSGSTGKPKGVQITLSNLHSFVKWASTLGNLVSRTDHIFLNAAPFSFDLSVMDLYLSLSSGGTLFSVDNQMISDPKDLFEHLKQSDATVFVCTPSFADFCLADSNFDSSMLPHLQCFLFCGETLTNKTADNLLDRFPNTQVVNLYGPTEATVSVTAVNIDKDICSNISPLPVGIIKPDCELIILDPTGSSVPDGEHGEIAIAGESVSIGYYKSPSLTEKSFFDWHGIRAYRTGDEGYLKNGMLYYCGRLDFQIKLNGYRIEIEDVENNIRRVDGIANTVVVPSFLDGKVSHLNAFVIMTSKDADRSLSGAIDLKHKLEAFIPKYMIPKRIIFKDNFPTNPNGKIDRKALAREVK